MNNNFFRSPLPPDEVQRQTATRRALQNHNQGRAVSMINTTTSGEVITGPLSAMSDIPMSSGDVLSGIAQQNTQQLHRRRSVPQPFTGQLGQDGSDRRLSLLELSPGSAFRDFEFRNIVSPTEDITRGFGEMESDLGVPGHSGTFSGPSLIAIPDQADYANLSPDLIGDMMAFTNLNVGNLSTDPSTLHLFDSPSVGGQYPPTSIGPVNTGFSMDMAMENGILAVADASPIVPKIEEDELMIEGTFGPADDSEPPQARAALNIDPVLAPGPFPSSMHSPGTQEIPRVPSFQSPAPRPSGPSQTLSQISGPSSGSMVSTSITPATAGPAPPPENGTMKSIYSKSGFDMLRALWYVATRKNAKLNIGAVDMSCAFVVCDVTLNDCPIIYVSDNFQNLTGYNRHEIVGKNCRFLQSPDGNVEAGTRREFVENHAVYNLKEAIARGDEIQQSLINYRKGGKPFLNLLTMIPIPWDTDEIRYFIGFQIDLVECPEAISGHEGKGMTVSYTHSDIGQYIWEPPNQSHWELENGQTLGIDDVSTLLQSFNPKGIVSDWHKQSWDKMLLENADDVIHVLSLKGLFLYLSPSCKKILEYDPNELMGSSLNTICHPSDLVPVSRELKEAQVGTPVNFVFRIRRKKRGYMWFESHGSLFSEQGKGRKCIILVGRKRPVFSLRRRDLEANGGIGDSEIWAKVSTSGMFLFVSSHVRSLLDLQPGDLEGKSMQDLMRKETRPEFGRTMEKARQGKIVSCKHEIQNKRGQVLQALTTFYPGDTFQPGDTAGGHRLERLKPTFLFAQTKLLKASSRSIAPAPSAARSTTTAEDTTSASHASNVSGSTGRSVEPSAVVQTGRGEPLAPEAQGNAHLADDNMFDELNSTRCTSWQYELRQMERVNRMLAEELAQLLSNRKKRKRRKGGGMVRDCANCHTRSTPEWRRGPSGNRDLCNSCGLRWAKQTGRVSPRNSSRGGNGDVQSKKSNSPIHSSPLHREVSSIDMPSLEPASKKSATSASTTEDFNAPIAATTAAVSNANTPMTAAKGGGGFNPPPSQPLLEGGSGLGGGGMEMTSIQEERETSA